QEASLTTARPAPCLPARSGHWQRLSLSQASASLSGEGGRRTPINHALALKLWLRETKPAQIFLYIERIAVVYFAFSEAAPLSAFIPRSSSRWRCRCR